MPRFCLLLSLVSALGLSASSPFPAAAPKAEGVLLAEETGVGDPTGPKWRATTAPSTEACALH